MCCCQAQQVMHADEGASDPVTSLLRWCQRVACLTWSMAASVSRVTLPLSQATRQKSSMLPDSRKAMYAWQMAMSSGLVFWCCGKEAQKGGEVQQGVQGLAAVT
jgi:hypothetical protein